MRRMRLYSPLAQMMSGQVPFDLEDTWNQITADRGIDVYEEGDKIVVKAPVPGVPADDVEVTYEDGVLRIRATHEERQEDKDKKTAVYRQERVVSFDYATTFPRPVDSNQISADVQDGVVVITAPIAEAAKPKKIAVKAGK